MVSYKRENLKYLVFIKEVFISRNSKWKNIKISKWCSRWKELKVFNMMGVEKNLDFYHFEKASSAENSVTLRTGLSPFMGHITRLINKISKK